jgi:hypothetical protein
MLMKQIAADTGECIERPTMAKLKSYEEIVSWKKTEIEEFKFYNDAGRLSNFGVDVALLRVRDIC